MAGWFFACLLPVGGAQTKWSHSVLPAMRCTGRSPFGRHLAGAIRIVFVSRLRKKLAADPSVAIVAVHGVGYRLETGKFSADALAVD
jgi:hypothetical protein